MGWRHRRRRNPPTCKARSFSIPQGGLFYFFSSLFSILSSLHTSERNFYSTITSLHQLERTKPGLLDECFSAQEESSSSETFWKLIKAFSILLSCNNF